jgi:hypothetical protein
MVLLFKCYHDDLVWTVAVSAVFIVVVGALFVAVSSDSIICGPAEATTTTVRRTSSSSLLRLFIIYRIPCVRE